MYGNMGKALYLCRRNKYELLPAKLVKHPPRRFNISNPVVARTYYGICFYVKSTIVYSASKG